MLGKILRAAAALLACVYLSGCSGQDPGPEDVQDVQGTAGYRKTSSFVDGAASSTVQFSGGEWIPVMKDGKNYGYVRINQVEEIGINDWHNTKAVKANIEHSYSVNFTVRYTGELANGGQKTVCCYPYLVEGEKTCGDPCIVGWSGFPAEAAVSEGSRTVWAEYGVQPTCRLSKKTELMLILCDSDDIVYDPVVLGHGVLKDRVRGPSLLKNRADRQMDSINGGRYSVGIGNSNYEYNYLNGDSSSRVRAFGFTYKVSYLKRPSNRRVVSNFDTGRRDMLRTKSVIGVQSNSAPDVLYSDTAYAYRRKYSDSDVTEPYVPVSGLKIHEGYYAEYNANRVLEDDVSGWPEYLRFRFEFPEEAEARSDKEKLEFNGRFIVMQRKITSRKLYSEKDYGEDGRLLDTSDDNAKEDD